LIRAISAPSAADTGGGAGAAWVLVAVPAPLGADVVVTLHPAAHIKIGTRRNERCMIYHPVSDQPAHGAIVPVTNAGGEAYYRATGPGWQLRINEALRRVADL